MMTVSRLSITLLLVALVLGAGAARAQTTDDAELEPRGTNRALSFFFDGLNLDSFDGGVGGKSWLGPSTALRYSIDFGVESTEDVRDDDRDAGRSAINVGTSLFVELHQSERGRVSPYIGSGFGFSTGAFSETTDFAPGNTVTRTRFKGSNFDFDVSVGFGIEYRIARRVSLGGEHQVGARVRIASTDTKTTFADPNTPNNVVERDIRTFRLDTGASRLILSVYF